MKLRDVRQPLRVWLLCMEVPLNYIRNSRSYLSFVGVVLSPPDIRNDELIFLHDAPDHFFRNGYRISLKGAMDSAVAISAG